MTRAHDFTVPRRCKEVWFGGRMAKGLMQNARQYGLQWQGPTAKLPQDCTANG